MVSDSFDVLYLNKIYTVVDTVTYYDGNLCFVAYSKYPEYDQNNNKFSFIPINQCKIYREKHKIQ